VTLAREVAEAALHAASEEQAEVVVLSERSGLARFAASEVHQPTLIENVVVNLRIVRDGRVGSAQTNRLDEHGLSELARRAVEAAESTRAEPGFPGLAPPEPVAEVEGYDEATAALGPAELATIARAAIEAAEPAPTYGFVTSAATEVAVVSTSGIAVEQRLTDAVALIVAADEGASGYAEQTAWALGAIDPAAVAREAAAKMTRTRGAKTIEPGHYRAVLEPYAIGELLQHFAYDSFSALGLIEQRSFLAGKLGTKVFDERISITDDALDPAGLPKAFDFEGVPKQRVSLIEHGVARGVVWDRETAALAGGDVRSTGHAPPLLSRDYGPLPFALAVAPGEAGSVEELAELVGEGIYVTRLHYLSTVAARDGVITGMTRDGTFRIRGGKIAEPLANLRFTVSVPEMLHEVPGLTRRAALMNQNDFYGERYPFGVLAPALATTRFMISGVGSSPGI
jgi:predicted Zn-dependent protease